MIPGWAYELGYREAQHKETTRKHGRECDGKLHVSYEGGGVGTFVYCDVCKTIWFAHDECSDLRDADVIMAVNAYYLRTNHHECVWCKAKRGKWVPMGIHRVCMTCATAKCEDGWKMCYT